MNQQCLDTSVTLVLVPQETAGKYFRTCAEATELRIGRTGHTLLEKSREGRRHRAEVSTGDFSRGVYWA